MNAKGSVFLKTLKLRESSARYVLRAVRMPFAFSFIATTQRRWVKMDPCQVQVYGPPLSAKGSFFGFDPADRMLSGYSYKKKDSHISELIFSVNYCLSKSQNIATRRSILGV